MFWGSADTVRMVSVKGFGRLSRSLSVAVSAQVSWLIPARRLGQLVALG